MTAFDAAHLESLKSGLPAWRAEQMSSAFEVFERLEEPTGVEEDWRYVDFPYRFSDLTPASTPGDALTAGQFVGAIGEGSADALIVDGHVVNLVESDHLSRVFEGPERSSPVPSDHNKLAAAHAAFSSDGVRIDVADGQALTDPIVVEVQGVSEDTVSFPTLVIDVGANAEARVVVIYRSAPGVSLLMVPEVDIRIGDGGNLRLLSLQSLDHAGSAVVHQRAHIGRDATSRIGEVGLGGDLGRLDINVFLDGDGSSSEIVGLYFGEGSQTLDYRMVITHEGRSTSSDVFLKGALEDEAQSVFTGLIRIEKDAEKTSSFETNRNLVLSEHAKAHSVPNLEILCNDVICGHGSSVGPLEEEHLYYLQSRGLRKERAERMLIRGFFAEVIDRLPISGLEEPVATEVFNRFLHAQGSTR